MLAEITKWAKALRENRSLTKTLKNWFEINDIKAGRFVGQDALGNKYYENRDEVVYQRDRWVQYNQQNFPREPSQIPPEWHAWMHRMTDVPPSSEQAIERFYVDKAHFALSDHQGNRTGGDSGFRTYSTTYPRYQAWVPQSKQR
ncbi:hypothetical protein MIR68_010111 [Amoeboaphelidium protococcarum]|nr:hypothetical protein MIR68_010111 [Amoeboaphelidium protococcarum]